MPFETVITSKMPRVTPDRAAGPALALQGKRIGMVTFSPYPADPRPRRTVDALIRQGAAVDLICLRGSQAHAPAEAGSQLRITHIGIKNRRKGTLSYAYQYSAFILFSTVIFALRCIRRRYDLIYVHNMPDILVISAMIPKLFGAKVILDLHDPMPELMMTIFALGPDSFPVRLLRRLEKWSIQRVHLVLTVNRSCKRLFAARSCPADKIGVVMNSPDEDFFPILAPGRLPRETSPAAKPFVLMYHGSLVQRNGLDLAISAIARIRQELPNVELRIYGLATPFLDAAMCDVERLGLQGAVRFLGPKRLEDLAPEIRGCDAGIVPNHRTAFAEINTPTRIFEYLSAGKPVIAPRTAGIQDYFSSNLLVFFEAGDLLDLSDKIRYVACHTDEAARSALQAQQVLLAHTWTKERNTLIHLIGGLLNVRSVQ